MTESVSGSTRSSNELSWLNGMRSPWSVESPLTFTNESDAFDASLRSIIQRANHVSLSTRTSIRPRARARALDELTGAAALRRRSGSHGATAVRSHSRFCRSSRHWRPHTRECRVRLSTKAPDKQTQSTYSVVIFAGGTTDANDAIWFFARFLAAAAAAAAVGRR